MPGKRPPLASADLNLLVVFDTVVAERSVKAAAHKLGLTPSATSHALRRLRELLKDPILVRAPDGMVPTPRALALAAPLRQALSQIEKSLYSAEGFDPATARRTFTIAADDYGALVVLPDLLPRLAREAPGIDLVVVTSSRAIWTDLAETNVDLVIAPNAPDRADLRRSRLFDDRFVCLLRRAHADAVG